MESREASQPPPPPPCTAQPELRVQLESQTPYSAQSTAASAQVYTSYQTEAPQPPLHTSTVVVQTTIMNRVPVGRDPTFIRCPSCQSDVVTVIHSTTTRRTHAAAIALCLVGLWACMCIPYCVSCCKTSNHYCPACSSYVGSRKN
ncbi:hypothetical protein KR222_011749 [Zaprionus bogoriensis]|nr:hypothetical protein KR222_011749 [Zaprionus bogoriensis]